MNNTNSYKNKYLKILVLFVLCVPAILFLFKILSSSFNIIPDVFEKATSSKGGKFESFVILLSPIGALIWIWFIYQKKYLKALCFQIIIFPFTYKSAKAFAINAYTMSNGYSQQISFTTFFILALFFILLINGLIIRPKEKDWRKFEVLILGFALTLTIAQLFNHNVNNGLWLSIGAVWQFIGLFYIISSLVKNEADVYYIFDALLIFCLVNILVRVLGEKQVLIQRLGSSVYRVGEGAMGPAVSYAGYLALLITISIALYRCKNKKKYLVISAILLIELLNTFTRGGFIVLFLFSIVVIFKQERKFYKKSLIYILPFIIIFGRYIWSYASYRGLSFNKDFTSIQSVSGRVQLMQIYLREYFQLTLTGHGIGKPTLITLSGISYTPHNILIGMFDSSGLVVVLLFIIIFSFAALVAFKKAKFDNNFTSKIIYGYTFIALIQWFVFANTTSTSLFGYYPYEASVIFWILTFLPFLNFDRNSSKYLLEKSN